MNAPVTFQEIGPGLRERRAADQRGWIAVTAGKEEVGTIICRSGSGARFEVVYLTVAPRARRHGVGQGLVAAAMEAAVVDGHQKVSARVPAGHSTLLHLFLGLGFVPVGASHPGGGDGEPLIVLERHLDDWLDDELIAGHDSSQCVANPIPFGCEELMP